MVGVTVPEERTARFVRLLASASGLSAAASPTVAVGSDLSFPNTSSGSDVWGLSVYVASLCNGAGERLLGGSEEQRLEVESLVDKETSVVPYAADKVECLNDRLASRTFVAGHTLTVADLYVFAAVEKLAPKFPTHVARWYDFVSCTVDSDQLFAKLSLDKPAFEAPPPPTPTPKPAKEDAAAEPEAAAPGKKKDKKEKKEKKKEGDAGAAAAPADAEPTVDLLDLRVGRITKVERHPDADALYVETIDLGEAEPRQIVSGLVKFVPEERMQGRMVVVVCNLKPAKMRNVMSYGMVLCASNDAHDAVDPINPPEGLQVGERITFEGYSAEPLAQLPPKKKQFEAIAPHLVTSDKGLCTYKGVPFMTSAGPVTATIPNAHIA
ncbi:putative tRNA binding domain-containing protein [Helicosporidium sp. ATCC 50920]|nr:putative tRNA binding domain-containing protein [Helicosporidium sp. ATCC 50920]|eukprot:KDD75141.1 putative tRNA binding domain-containing protein [Helicosporidium sp. ATCC 50920]